MGVCVCVCRTNIRICIRIQPTPGSMLISFLFHVQNSRLNFQWFGCRNSLKLLLLTFYTASQRTIRRRGINDFTFIYWKLDLFAFWWLLNSCARAISTPIVREKNNYSFIANPCECHQFEFHCFSVSLFTQFVFFVFSFSLIFQHSRFLISFHFLFIIIICHSFEHEHCNADEICKMPLQTFKNTVQIGQRPKKQTKKYTKTCWDSELFCVDEERWWMSSYKIVRGVR